MPGSPFLAACRGERTERVPVWFMRQAGRSLPEYRAVRGTGDILSALRDPATAAELTLQPVRRYGVDAAIVFSDIVAPVAATGFAIRIEPGRGPVVDEPLRSAADVDRLRPLEPETDAPWIAEAVRLAVADLGGDPAGGGTPLIGFAGAPFTVASYLIEGGPSRTYTRTKALMWSDGPTWRRLLDVLADMAVASLRAQVAAGASAVQLFDSWAGALAPGDYERHVLPASRRVLGALADLGVPRIHFGVGTGELLGLMAGAGCEVVGVDWHVPLDTARRRVGPTVAVQGNLDPAAVLAPWPVLEAAATEALARGGGRGHVFNLGHGVLPESDPAVLGRLVDLVHAWRPGAGPDSPDSPDGAAAPPP